MRYGGEEFCIILPGASKEDSFTMAERIRFAVENSKVIYTGSEIKVTLSLGIASYPESEINQENDLISLNLPPYGPGSFATFAEALKEVLAVPVIVASKISPRLGERILRQRKADFIAMGRPLVADPELPNKLASGKLDEIAPCLYCNCCAVDPFSRDCTVNAAMGREQEYAIKPAEQVKKILVVGGGPAGMEAARVAAMRGHQVVLCEKQRRLGGQLIIAGIVKDEYESLNRYLSTQMKKLGVEVITGKEVTPAVIDHLRQDAVIVATGGIPVVPDIPGIHGDNVLSTEGSSRRIKPHTLSRTWVKPSHWRKVLWSLGLAFLRTSHGALFIKRLIGRVSPFGRKVVIMGSGLPALQLASFLLEKDKNVTILATEETLVSGQRPMHPLSSYLFHRLSTRGVRMLTQVKYQEILNRGITIIDKDGNYRTIEADTIVLAQGAIRNDRLANELNKKCPDVYLVGDATEPFGIREAIADGSRIARMI